MMLTVQAQQRSGLASAQQTGHFEVGMRLEAVDRQNPSMICVATVVGVKKSDRQVEIHFDGWSDYYNYWCSYSDGDIHPIGWCARSQRTVHKPKGTSKFHLCSRSSH